MGKEWEKIVIIRISAKEIIYLVKKKDKVEKKRYSYFIGIIFI